MSSRLTCKFCNTTNDVYKIEPLKGKPCVCLKCLEKAKLCDTCGDLHIYNETVAYVEGPNQYLCTDCAGDLQKCTRCGSLTSGKSKVGSKCVCPTCIEKDYFRCDCCSLLRLKSAKISKLDYYKYEGVLDGRDSCRRCFRTRTKDIKPKVLYNCTACDDITSKKYLLEGKEQPFCDTCSEKLLSCTHCAERFFYDGGYPLAEVNGHPLCNNCKTDHYSRCRVCGGFHLKSEGVKFKRHTVCESCAEKIYTCEHCEDVHLGDPHKIKGKKYCIYCYKLYQTCGFCSHKGFDVEEYENQGGGMACLKCRTQHGLFKIKRWNHTPRRTELIGEGSLHFGVELELSCTDGNEGKRRLCEYIAKQGNPNIYIKHDGSIDNGVEVVAHPATFDRINTIGLDVLFKQKNIVPSDSCGMHVHLSRTAFTSLHLFKLMKFFHILQPEIEKFAGRSYDFTNYKTGRQYCKKTEEHEIEPFIRGEMKDKYREVRLNCENTIEIRIFRGVTDASEMYRNIEFCHAVFYYTKDHEGFTWGDFASYVKANARQYPNLIQYFNA